MPAWGDFESRLSQILNSYSAQFPESWFPADMCGHSTHITPVAGGYFAHRIKKLYLTISDPRPKKRASVGSYVAMPALVMTMHRKDAKKKMVVFNVINLITDKQETHTVPVSETDDEVNARLLDLFFRTFKKQLWILGRARPNHYCE